ncbi:hypothetical protein JTE90_022669 [Oedothorax gibbosus]|uniref:Uncharacterized protein n=1 Tax=Oedothorax gibbosus TaxID=931172 RepID=A0AAV6ULQ9_9ARAC|nr:hypothetical protein JTE90_022669 [Oedothorax gibbosus]
MIRPQPMHIPPRVPKIVKNSLFHFGSDANGIPPRLGGTSSNVQSLPFTFAAAVRSSAGKKNSSRNCHRLPLWNVRGDQAHLSKVREF